MACPQMASPSRRSARTMAPVSPCRPKVSKTPAAPTVSCASPPSRPQSQHPSSSPRTRPSLRSGDSCSLLVDTVPDLPLSLRSRSRWPPANNPTSPRSHHHQFIRPPGLRLPPPPRWKLSANTTRNARNQLDRTRCLAVASFFPWSSADRLVPGDFSLYHPLCWLEPRP